jgi:hypothetical protein
MFAGQAVTYVCRTGSNISNTCFERSARRGGFVLTAYLSWEKFQKEFNVLGLVVTNMITRELQRCTTIQWCKLHTFKAGGLPLR